MLETSDIHEERVRNFLEERASFSPQLFTLLPFLAKKLDFVMLSSEIIEGLKLLIRYRNDMIHRGKTKSHFNKAQYENMLLSSFFTVKYYSIIHGVQPS